MKISAILLACLVAGIGSAAAQESVNRTVPTSATGSVEIVNTAGEVRVTGWDRNEIRITGTLGAGTERLAVESSGNRTEIRVVLPRNGRNIKGSDLEIRVPSRKDVTIRTVSADIGVDGVDGIVNSQAVSGDVRVQGSPRQIKASSTSGDVNLRVNTARVQANTTSGDVNLSGTVRESITAESVSGDVEVTASAPELIAKSVSGDLELSGVSRRVTAGTVSGTARIRAGQIQYGSFETVSGGLAFEGDLQRDAAFNIQSHSGDVVLSFPANVAANFQVSTFSGDIDNDFGRAAERTSRYGPGQELRFTNGSGGALVTVKTFSGSVKLRRR